ncbi:MAG: hypothetical protein GY849_17970 [Deltaproteobacteria bacterium]|nr:hypothetical protein [Deltaproteobacteria bacterium]
MNQIYIILANRLMLYRKPKRNRRNGITIYFARDENEKNLADLPVITTDIKKGQIIYDLPKAFVKDNYLIEVKLKY